MLINDWYKLGYMQGYNTGVFETQEWENMNDQEQQAFRDGYEKGVGFYCQQMEVQSA